MLQTCRSRFQYSIPFLLLGALVWLTWAHLRQDRLDRSLIQAVADHDALQVRTLLASGANPDARQRFDQPSMGFLERLRDLLRGGDRTTVPGDTALILAAESWRTDLVQLLLQHGASANLKGPNRRTALMEAAERGAADTVRALLERGADPHATDYLGETALHAAARQGANEVILLLLNGGAEVDARDSEDQTPLMMVHDHADAARVLLEHGADVRARDAVGSTALMHAVQWSHTEWNHREWDHTDLIALLRRAGAKE